jgi:hypothetical protein
VSADLFCFGAIFVRQGTSHSVIRLLCAGIDFKAALAAFATDHHSHKIFLSKLIVF